MNISAPRDRTPFLTGMLRGTAALTLAASLVLPGLAFHAIIYVTLPVYTFSATMALLYLAYFDADAVDKVIARLQGTGSAATARGEIS